VNTAASGAEQYECAGSAQPAGFTLSTYGIETFTRAKARHLRSS